MTRRDVGRNEPCTCGSGKKHKHCCLGRANGTAGTEHSQTAARLTLIPPEKNPLTSYIQAYSACCTRLELSRVDLMERRNACPELPEYLKLHEELRNEVEMVLLPAVMPSAFRQCVHGVNSPMEMSRLLREVALCAGFDDYRHATIDVREIRELRHVVDSDEYSFSLCSVPRFPVLFKKGGTGYAPQYVANVPVYSRVLDDVLALPTVHHSWDTVKEFSGQVSFVHELLHVMQRVLRKEPLIHYVYRTENGHLVKNPVSYVRTGVEDEIEVQSILVRAGYEFSINPILHHRKNLDHAFLHTPPDEAQQVIREGLEGIPFGKYEHLHPELRLKVLDAYCGPT
jgi:hypothetical protein